jgi:hypothetical protein
VVTSQVRLAEDQHPVQELAAQGACRDVIQRGTRSGELGQFRGDGRSAASGGRQRRLA